MGLERVGRQSAAIGLALRGAIASPLLGPAGNREFLFWLAVGSPGERSAAPFDEAWLHVFDELARA